LLFEVYNLEFASPATISRCGMVYVDQKTVSPGDFFKKWTKKYSEVILDTEEKLSDYFVEIFDLII
jgi:dynein heavy chain